MMAENDEKRDRLLHENLAKLGPRLALPDAPSPLQQARWKKLPESPAQKGIRLMKKHMFSTIGGAIAATIGLSVLVFNLTTEQVSAAEIFRNFKQSVGESMLVTFNVRDTDEGVAVKGRLFTREREPGVDDGRTQDVYAKVHVTADDEGGDMAGLDVRVEASVVPGQEWVYIKLDGLPAKKVQEEPLLAIFGAVAQNGVLFKLDGLREQVLGEFDDVRHDVLSELQQAFGEIGSMNLRKLAPSASGADAFEDVDLEELEALKPVQVELARSLKDLIKGKGTADSLDRLVTWIEQNATKTSIDQIGGVHVLTAKGFAEIVGDEEISADDRALLDDMEVEIAYTRKKGVQWASVDVADIVDVKLDLANPEIDADLFSSERFVNDGVTQVFDLASLMKMFGSFSDSED